jgi:MerR family mercuric resistance operon transcriptional regulator
MQIGERSRRTGCNIETIRYYERLALLPSPVRSAGRYRIYDTAAVRRLAFIRRARELGFRLDEVRTLLDLSADDRQGACANAKLTCASSQQVTLQRSGQKLSIYRQWTYLGGCRTAVRSRRTARLSDNRCSCGQLWRNPTLAGRKQLASEGMTRQYARRMIVRPRDTEELQLGCIPASALAAGSSGHSYSASGSINSVGRSSSPPGY